MSAVTYPHDFGPSGLMYACAKCGRLNALEPRGAECLAAMRERISELEAELVAIKLRGPLAFPLDFTRQLRMCPETERPCGVGCDFLDRCVLTGCRHLQTMQSVVGDAPGFSSVQTTCMACGEVIP